MELSRHLFKQSELRRLHLHFLHPTTDKLIQLLQGVYPQDTDESMKKLLREIAESLK